MKGAATAVVRRFTDAIARFDYEAAFALVAEDCEYRNMPDPATLIPGRAAARQLVEAVFSATIENEFRVLREAEEGAIVLQERLDRHRLRDGSWVELPVAAAFEVHEGLIRVWRDYFDARSFEKAWPSA